MLRQQQQQQDKAEALPTATPGAPTITDELQMLIDKRVHLAMELLDSEMLFGWLQNPTFSFATEEGFLKLSPTTLQQLNVSVITITLPRCVRVSLLCLSLRCCLCV